MSRVQIPASKVHAQGLTDPGAGEHLWTTIVVFRVSPAAIEKLGRGEDPGPLLLDHENALTVEGPGCYKCEEPYSKRMAFRQCKGSMQLLV